MRARIFIAAVVLACLAQAKEPKRQQTGTLLQMDSAECGVDENSGKSVVGELVGTDSAHKKTHARPSPGISPEQPDRATASAVSLTKSISVGRCQWPKKLYTAPEGEEVAAGGRPR